MTLHLCDGRFARIALLVLVVWMPRALAAPASSYFAIQFVDEQTGRPIPLVEARTVNHIRYVSDSAGLVAVDEPGLMGQRVFFHLFSHGYEVPKDGFGMRGRALDVRAGEQAVVKLKRVNIAERLYRVTGQGIYRDSVLLGREVPLKRAVMNGLVMGQDSTQCVPYNGKLYWFWGDTNRAAYPLGNFQTTGATSLLAKDGGLDPAMGVDLAYMTNAEGFTRPVAGALGKNLVWIDSVLTVKGPDGRERMLTHYTHLRAMTERLEHGWAVFNDDSQSFEKVVEFPLEHMLKTTSHALKHAVDGVEYFYFCTVYPVMRVRAEWSAINDPAAYEGFTPLVEGTRFDKEKTKLERDGEGRLVRGWKRGTPAVNHEQEQQLIRAGAMKAEEAYYVMRDVETNELILMHQGSVEYNAFRKKFVMIAPQLGGKRSMLGEVFYSEAEKPEGPWLRARKVLTHDRYSFYNPKHHPYFDQEGGRVIYFEGTYVTTFSRKDDDNPTPRYDYNQVMYRLDLADPRLKLDQKE